MSYEIVKGIKIDIKEQIVKIKSASSNVFPKDFSWWPSNYLTELLKEKGKIAVIKEILYHYWSGNFQKTNNNFEKSLILLDRKKYNWDTVRSDSSKSCTDPTNIPIVELKNVLYENYLKYNNRKKGNFYIVHKETSKYLGNITKNRYYLYENPNPKIKFSSKEEAEFKLYKSFVNLKDFDIIEKIN